MVGDRILFVDDEENVLTAIRRQLRRDFTVSVAVGGRQAIEKLSTEGPFAVAVCDMRMPGMDGVETLTAIEKASPDTVRMMLTGNADQETAVEAINQGHIFRFLNKPCPEDVLRKAIADALRHHHLITAEKTLLQHTLAGSVKVLMDVLSMVDPAAYGDAARMRGWSRQMQAELKLANPWELDMAVTLSPIGLVAVLPEVLHKHRDGAPLTEAEADMIARAPETARRLIANIPRLSGVAEIVYHQDQDFDGGGFPTENAKSGEDLPIGARILHLLKGLAAITRSENPSAEDVASLVREQGRYDPALLALAKKLWSVSQANFLPSGEVKDITLATLLPGDRLVSDIVAQNGSLLLSEGNKVTPAQIERLRNIAKVQKLVEPIRVARQMKAGAA